MKQALIIHAFKDWVWTHDERKRRLTEIYDSTYGCIRRRVFDGSFLRFPGMAEDKDYDERVIQLREALKDLDKKLGVGEYERGR